MSAFMNSAPYKIVAGDAANGRLSHAYLLVCPDVRNLRGFLKELAKLIFGADERVGGLIEREMYADCLVLPAEGSKFTVADAKTVTDESYIKPVEGDKKLFVLDGVQDMNASAQNKLLKVLEEPPKNVYFLISCSQSDKVLPTIKSRCDKINVEKLTDDELKKICQSPLACMLSEGYAGRALMLEKNKDLQDIVDFAISLICELKNSSQVLRFSREFQDRKGNMELVLKTFSLALEDMVKIKTEKEELCTLKEYLPMLKSVESEFSVSAICEINSLISHFLEKLQFNANLSMAVDNFLLKVLEVKYLCK